MADIREQTSESNSPTTQALKDGGRPSKHEVSYVLPTGLQ